MKPFRLFAPPTRPAAPAASFFAGPARLRPAGAAYLTALARLPRPDDQADALAFLREQAESYVAAGKGDGGDAALVDFCQALLCLNEFVYVE
jgi:hypothetical protein